MEITKGGLPRHSVFLRTCDPNIEGIPLQIDFMRKKDNKLVDEGDETDASQNDELNQIREVNTNPKKKSNKNDELNQIREVNTTPKKKSNKKSKKKGLEEGIMQEEELNTQLDEDDNDELSHLNANSL